jgi:Rps23 Pro-64 3,4-dihydroxylase Tpa1-like proline 4-hydroxylase
MAYINPRLDRAAMRATLARDGRVQIRDFFEPPVVEALLGAVDAVDWRLLFRDDTGDRKLLGEEMRALSPGAKADLAAHIHLLAEREYQYLFHSHSMVDTAKSGEVDLLTRFVRWMADDEFMSAMRGLTGVDDINRVYAQATLYGRGNFLLMHNDETPLERRRIAYVINLARDWRRQRARHVRPAFQFAVAVHRAAAALRLVRRALRAGQALCDHRLADRGIKKGAPRSPFRVAVMRGYYFQTNLRPA